MVFSLFKKRGIGIDIGSRSIKIVELSRLGKKTKLENYVEVKGNWETPFSISKIKEKKNSFHQLANVIKKVLDKANIKTKKAVCTLPDFSTLFTWFELPPMKQEEIPGAVKHEARRHIPFPLDEVTLDWQVIEGQEKKGKIKILLVVVPNELINSYLEIAKMAQIHLYAIEAEVFAFARTLPQKDVKTLALIDIGFESTTCSILENGVLKRSYSFDISGDKITKSVANFLKINYNEAEKLKKEYGILEKKGKPEIRKPILFCVQKILEETKKVMDEFHQTELKPVQKVVLSGGGALLPGLKDYLRTNLEKEVEVINPFSNLIYPEILKDKIEKMGPFFTIAVGAGLRALI